MILSLNTILMHLEKYGPLYAPELPADRMISGMEYYVAGKVPQKNILYLLQEQDFDAVSSRPGHAVFCSVKNDTCANSTILKNTVLFSKADCLQEIFESYTRLINDMSLWDRRMHDALLHDCSLSDLLQIAADRIPFPIMFFDSGFNVTEFCPGSDPEIHGFESAALLGYTPPEFMQKIRQQNLLEEVQASSRAVLHGAISNEASYNLYRCHRVDGRVAGYSTVFCGSQKPHPGFLDICEFYFDAVDLYQKITIRSDRTQTYMYENLLTTLLGSERYSDRRLADHLAYLDIPGTGIFTLVKFLFEKRTEYHSYLCNILQKYFPDLYFFVYQDHVCLLHHAPDIGEVFRHKDSMRRLLTGIRGRLGDSYPMLCFISHPFHQLSDLYYAGRQCDELLELMQRGAEANGFLVFFEDNLANAALTRLQDTLSPKNLLPPAFVQLRRYDKKHHTQLAETLRVYIESGGSLQTAAECLGLHRNSVDKRIQKIEALFGLDLKNTHTIIQLYCAFTLEKL